MRSSARWYVLSAPDQRSRVVTSRVNADDLGARAGRVAEPDHTGEPADRTRARAARDGVRHRVRAGAAQQGDARREWPRQRVLERGRARRRRAQRAQRQSRKIEREWR